MRTLFLFFLAIALVSCDFTSAKTYFAEATKLEKENRLSEAIKILNKAIQADENYLPARADALEIFVSYKC